MKIRLKERCFFQGHLHQAGDVITLPDGMRGPHRAVRKGAPAIDYDPGNGLDANHTIGETVDEPLFEEIE